MTPGRGLYIVQFVGPIKDAWLKTLKSTGADVVSYVANNAYVVCCDARSAALVSRLQRRATVRPVDGRLPAGLQDDAGAGGRADDGRRRLRQSHGASAGRRGGERSTGIQPAQLLAPVHQREARHELPQHHRRHSGLAIDRTCRERRTSSRSKKPPSAAAWTRPRARSSRAIFQAIAPPARAICLGSRARASTARNSALSP